MEEFEKNKQTLSEEIAINCTLPEELRVAFKSLEKLYGLAYKEIRPEILYIIKNNIKDIGLIEHKLDMLLNIPSKECYILFVKLCEYVSKFNKTLADEYLDIYRDLYEEDVSIVKKKSN